MASTSFSSATSSKPNTEDTLLDVETFIATTIPIRERDPYTAKLLDNLVEIYEKHLHDSKDEACTMTPIITDVYSIKSADSLPSSESPAPS